VRLQINEPIYRLSAKAGKERWGRINPVNIGLGPQHGADNPGADVPPFLITWDLFRMIARKGEERREEKRGEWASVLQAIADTDMGGVSRTSADWNLNFK